MLAAAALSLAGFGAFLAQDLDIVRGKAGLRAAAAVAGPASLLSAAAISWPQGASLSLPAWGRPAGAALAAAGAILLAYSLYIELARAPKPAGARQPPLVRTGTYALCRHPGYWWLLLFLAGLVLAAGRSGMLQLAVGWAGLNLALVTAQDRVLFPRRFPEYPQYRRVTPFLVPNAASIRSAIHSARGSA
jgi:protein-S-isoprenylcysteine O-methyltransferase Ste14